MKRKERNMKKVQHRKSATQKERSMKKVQYEMSTT